MLVVITSCARFFCCRLTLLLGPPASGKTTLLLALAGKLDSSLKVLFFTLLKLSSWMCLAMSIVKFTLCFSLFGFLSTSRMKISLYRFLVG